MVRSDNFTDVIAMVVATDKQGVVSFMRSEGINVSLSEDVKSITKTLLMSLVKSEVFKTNFIRWAESRYQNYSNYGGTFSVNGVRYTQAEWEAFKKARAKANKKKQKEFSGESNASGFDPMATQGSGQEFDAMSSQQGANLKEDGFANASGEFDTMSTQSGGFSTTETQFANSDGEGGWLSNLFGGNSTPYDATTGTGGTGVGNALRKVNWNDLINNGVGIWQQTEQNKVQRDTINAGIKAKQLELDTALANGEITRQSYEAQLELARLDKNAPQSTVYLWIIGGVVLLGALGTTIYFATRKK